ncbi:MAG: nitroreductase [Limnohabitans sp.]
MSALPSSQVSTVIADPLSVDVAIQSRFSARAYLPREVDKEVLEDLLQVAGRAPSGTNTQPWNVYVLQGARKDQLIQSVCQAHDALAADPALAADYAEAYDYYPSEWVSPYIERRRECGFGLYGVLGIAKGEKEKIHMQHQQNYRFFGAPVGLVFTIDRIMGRGSLLDYGMFLQSVMVAARARGLHTCPQAAWNSFSKIIMPHVGAGENEMLVCSMSLGYADEAALVNTFQTTRVDAKTFTHWVE